MDTGKALSGQIKYVRAPRERHVVDALTKAETKVELSRMPQRLNLGRPTGRPKTAHQLNALAMTNQRRQQTDGYHSYSSNNHHRDYRTYKYRSHGNDNQYRD